eukprot:6439859-Pyramimonas_sp.AAC.1
MCIRHSPSPPPPPIPSSSVVVFAVVILMRRSGEDTQEYACERLGGACPYVSLVTVRRARLYYI